MGTSALKWTVGGIYQENESLDNYGPPANNLFGVPGGTLDVDLFNWTVYSEESFEAWAAFGEVSYAVSDRLNIGAGLRYSKMTGGVVQSPALRLTRERSTARILGSSSIIECWTT